MKFRYFNHDMEEGETTISVISFLIYCKYNKKWPSTFSSQTSLPYFAYLGYRSTSIFFYPLNFMTNKMKGKEEWSKQW